MSEDSVRIQWSKKCLRYNPKPSGPSELIPEDDDNGEALLQELQQKLDSMREELTRPRVERPVDSPISVRVTGLNIGNIRLRAGDRKVLRWKSEMFRFSTPAGCCRLPYLPGVGVVAILAGVASEELGPGAVSPLWLLTIRAQISTSIQQYACSSCGPECRASCVCYWYTFLGGSSAPDGSMAPDGLMTPGRPPSPGGIPYPSGSTNPRGSRIPWAPDVRSRQNRRQCKRHTAENVRREHDARSGFELPCGALASNAVTHKKSNYKGKRLN